MLQTDYGIDHADHTRERPSQHTTDKAMNNTVPTAQPRKKDQPFICGVIRLLHDDAVQFRPINSCASQHYSPELSRFTFITRQVRELFLYCTVT